ncbi:hypothetical protein [Haloprofundus sp. MHR1]|uniref:hypothetical protein n=1 Tax=Haloprofundus sp. MHR1 TaxID=2572921 RepID=UPI0010BEF319|nr:hypothetical protein [Haloprofundus sp. MHR1]QCJ45649.1 hypothetical protein FCF25_00260 [Haloprofundus sp. MHR1]
MQESPIIPDFNLNHPKNYFGYTIAVASAASELDIEAATLLNMENENEKKINGDVEGSRDGARNLGLITTTADVDMITGLGQRVVTVGTTEHGSKQAALEAFRSLYRRRTKFLDRFPEWRSITQEVMRNQPGVARLVTLMQEIQIVRGDSALPLPLLVQEIYHRDPEFARSCFITSERREQIDSFDWKPAGSDSTPNELWNPKLYRPSIVHQFKSMLWHSGILTTKGKTRSSLEFSENLEQFTWALTPSFLEEATQQAQKNPKLGERRDCDE